MVLQTAGCYWLDIGKENKCFDKSLRDNIFSRRNTFFQISFNQYFFATIFCVLSQIRFCYILSNSVYRSWKEWNGIVSKVMGSPESWLTLAKFGSSWLKIADLWHWTQMNSEKRKTIWIFWWFDYTKWLNQIDICLWKNTRPWDPFLLLSKVKRLDWFFWLTPLREYCECVEWG